MTAAVAGGIAAAGSIGGSMISGAAAKSAAGTQAAAERHAADLEQAQYQQTRSDLLPDITMGQAGIPQLEAQYGNTNTDLTRAYNNAEAMRPTNMLTQADLVNSPSYQFQLAEGQKATQNSVAGMGLAKSGQAAKSAGNFATGLAGTYYTQDLNNQMTAYQAANQQFSNAYNKDNTLYQQAYGPVALGESAAAQSGQIGQAGAAAAGGNIAGAGAALGAGTAAAGNAYGGALANSANNAANSYMTAIAFKNALANGAGSGN